jgi:hypothetical protein
LEGLKMEVKNKPQKKDNEMIVEKEEEEVVEKFSSSIVK